MNITFNYIVSAIKFSDLTTIKTNDIRTNISAFARWVYKGHPAWPFWNKKIRNSFKQHIIDLYKNADSINSTEELLKQLYKISLKTIPDRHFSVSFANRKRVLAPEDRKTIRNKILSDLIPNEHIGHNLAKLDLKKLENLGIKIYIREDLSNIGKAWLFVGETNNDIGIIACTNLTTINPLTGTFSQEQFDKLTKMVKTVQKHHKKWKGIIIDLRDNTGGDSQFFEQIASIINGNKAFSISKKLWMRNTQENIYLLQKLNEHKKIIDIDKINKIKKTSKILCYQGAKTTIKKPYKQIRILTNKLVQSSSEGAIFQFGKCPTYKTVGENTGGCVIGFCPVSVTLPNGGIINIATRYSVRPIKCEEGIGIKPTIQCKNKDAFQVALKDITKKL